MSFVLIANPIDNPELFDHVFVGGVQSLLCEVTTPGLRYLLDKKKGPGTKKRTVTHRGMDGADVKVKFMMWTSDHFKAWEAYQNLFEWDPTKKILKAIDVAHPTLIFLGIHNFVTELIGPIVHEGKGLYTVTVELTEYSPPPKTNVTATPTSVRQGTTTVERVTVETEQDKELSKLLAQAAAP